MTDWTLYGFEESRVLCAAPRLEDVGLPASARAYQVLLLPTFHQPLAISAYDFGDHADVSVHAATKDGRGWRESKTIVGEPLETFRVAMQPIVAQPVSEAPVEGRDGILVEASWMLDGVLHRVHGWPATKVEPIARFAVALLSTALAALRFDESRAALTPIRSYF